MRSGESVKDMFHGVLPAIVTPFDEAGEFAEKVFERLLADLYQVGVHGMYVCGNTGEGSLQSVAMRQRVVEAAVRCSPKGKSVIAHVGGVRLPEAIQLARHAERIGASAVSALPPAGSYSFRELHHYYRQLAEACGLPFLVYFFPDLCRAIETLDQILELCEIPNVAGLKFTDFDLFKLHQVSSAGKVIFNGRDQVLAAGLLMGADGGIGSFYNLIPQLFVDVYACARTKQWEGARRAQDRINELIRITSRFPNVSAIKTMLKWRGYDCGRCIAPNENLTEAGELQLRELVKQSSFCNEILGPAI
ncbi:MAG: dihydrodipicolinate synthase family protein [Acidobacteria bacterium]|nr:dihydrodipicolinate synthase family protein [Acidobacteriota bacterium]